MTAELISTSPFKQDELHELLPPPPSPLLPPPEEDEEELTGSKSVAEQPVMFVV